MDRRTNLSRSASFNTLSHSTPPQSTSPAPYPTTSNPHLQNLQRDVPPQRTFSPPPGIAPQNQHHIQQGWEYVSKAGDPSPNSTWSGGTNGISPVSVGSGGGEGSPGGGLGVGISGMGLEGLVGGGGGGMTPTQKCAIFWDFENCPPPTNVPGYVVVEHIRKVVHHFGSIMLFKAYLQISETTKKSLRSELQSSGVSLTDTPHNARKDAADKMILVDMLAFAIDHPPPATIVLISGDRDFVYALSTLRNRRYNIILIVPNKGASVILKSQANAILEWRYDVINVDVSAAFAPSTEPPPLPTQPQPPLIPLTRSGSVPTFAEPGEGVGRKVGGTGLKVSTERKELTEEEAAEVGRYLYSPMAPGFFDLLVEVLNYCKMQGDPRPKRSKVAQEMLARNPLLAARANVKDPNDYMDMAAKSGIVIMGGDRPGLKGAEPWIAMNEEFVTAGFGGGV